MSNFTLTVEHFAQIWPEAEVLAKAHSAEVEVGLDSRRKFDLDVEMMEKLDAIGALLIIAARETSGSLIGYFTWQISLDPESTGLLIAQQGAWYTASGHPRAAYAMYSRSIMELRARKVQCIFPHHRLEGRGRGLGRFFTRQGAKPMQVTYELWIGEGEPNAQH